MSSIRLEQKCTCGATFEAEGDSMSVGFRQDAWLTKHQGCAKPAAVKEPTSAWERYGKTRALMVVTEDGVREVTNIRLHKGEHTIDFGRLEHALEWLGVTAELWWRA